MAKTFELYFSDLTEYAQQELLKKAGISKPEDKNWDVFPIFTFTLDDEEEEEDVWFRGVDLDLYTDILDLFMKDNSEQAKKDYLKEHTDVSLELLLHVANNITPSNLAYFMREAENEYIEELNERPKKYKVQSETAKSIICNYVYNKCDKEAQEEFEDICDSLAV